jgi:type IV secretion system protein VirB1
MPNGMRVQVRRRENHASWTREVWLTRRVNTDPVTSRLPTRRTAHPVGRSKAKPSVLRFYAATLIAVFYAMPAATLAVPLSQTQFATLASRCAPMVPAVTLEAVARTESGLDPWVLHDNTTGRKGDAGSPELAAAEATQWLEHGDSVDLGLMQINAANLPALGMTVSDTFDPCASLAGGAAVLRAAYGGGSTQAEQQAALLMALSRYNTGTPFRGIMNGYARTVLENAGMGEEALPIPSSPAQTPLFADLNAPPSWNVSAAGAYAQIHGASWLISLAPSVSDQRPQASPMGLSPPADAIASK